MASQDSTGIFASRTRLETWIRGRFARLNTALEEHYRCEMQTCPSPAPELCQDLLEEGSQLTSAVLRSGDLEAGSFDERFSLLGDVGLFLAACKRHGLNEPVAGHSPLAEASELALRLGRQLGVAPRFLAAHLSLLNPARDGRYKVFTNLEAERIFLDYNTRAILAYQQTAQLLKGVQSVGISSRWAVDLLGLAQQSLRVALDCNHSLMKELDVESFFFHVRPYYKPYLVGDRVFRGANAGDFAAISEVDLILGLGSAEDPFYRGVLDEKQDYLLPEDRLALERTRSRTSLMDGFLQETPRHQVPDWWEPSLESYLDVCRLHGAVAAVHHNALVERFIARPAQSLPEEQLQDLTASGPPLSELLTHLAKLRDLRLGVPREDIGSRHKDLAVLRARLIQREG